MDFVSLFVFLPFSPPHIRCSPKEEQFFFADVQADGALKDGDEDHHTRRRRAAHSAFHSPRPENWLKQKQNQNQNE